MTRIAPSEIETQADTKRPALQLRLPYPNEVARIISTLALDFCAKKMGLASRHAVADRLQIGDSKADEYYRYSIAKQIVEYLGALDEQITAVYIVDYDASPNDFCLGEGPPISLITLLVRVKQKTQDLDSLIERVNHALAQCYADMIGLPQLAHLLDVQVVEDQDVKNRVGYGAMFSSLYNRPIQIWER